MAVQTTAPGAPPSGERVAAAPQTGLNLGKTWREIRRLPIVPSLVLVIFLIVPAIFADALAQHDPLIGDLERDLEPPAWIGDREVEQTIVRRVRDKDSEVSLNNAARNYESGAAELRDANGNGAPDIGETMVRIKPGGSWDYPLGTDKQGRDLLTRMMHGARISLAVSCLAILVGGFLGTTLGMLAAFRGGITDAFLMRIVDIKLAFPSILLALTLVVAIGSGFSTVVIVIALLLWARYARVVRGEALAIKERDFIDRARVAGASNLRIMGRHIFPNVFNTVIVLATLEVGHVIILEATLSFLGAGIPRPQPAWGLMAADGAGGHYQFLVDFPVPLPGHCADGAVDEPAGGLAAGPAGSQAAECVGRGNRAGAASGPPPPVGNSFEPPNCYETGVDIKLAFPTILLALVLVAAIGAGFATVIIVIAVLLWARYARVVRGEALAIKQQDFIDRARVSGASNIRIMMRHIFPNLVNTVVVLATLEVGHVIILESTLSFLGAGIPAPTPAWGVMVADGRDLITTAWWIFLLPCLAIVLTVLSMNLLGDWLRDRLDPKLRNI